MAITNQRGKSSRRNKKLPYPGHGDLPGSSPRCPKASLLPPASLARAQIWCPLPRPRHLGTQPSFLLCILGLGTSCLWVSVSP